MKQGDHGEREEALLAADTRIGDFRIRGLLGEGAMGEVYLAQDTTLGRRVALKLIKRSMMRGDGAERFLEEARATARFNHPNIVTLHAVGEHDGRPFLALEYVDGESLRARMAGGPLPAQEALRYFRAIADAVAEAHRRGLIHADLKPENIVIPHDGRVRVVDFGLARMVGGTPDTASGTPAYMAPERWRGERPTGAIDVWSLGVLLCELILGHRPIPDRELAMLAFGGAPLPLAALPSHGWGPLARECLSSSAEARPTADELVRRVAALLDTRTDNEDGTRSPFPGLAAFTRENAGDYFGRVDELDALVEQLRQRPLVPIVGPSGIGKSSFVRAALVPRLEESGRWVTITLRPGSTPYENLATALSLPGSSSSLVAESLRRHPDALSLLLGDLAKHHKTRVLLFIDQFEESFTLASADAVSFCDSLGRAAITGEPWRIVLTLRDDYLGRLTESNAIRPHLGAVMPLAPLSNADLRAAILKPLAKAGYELDTPDLVQRIVDDVEDQPACLPLVQFTCQSLWERRDVANAKILAREYEAIGGATGALATHAQRLLRELTTEQVRLARSILLSLVNHDGTRRPRMRADLLETLPAGTDAVIERLLDRRLIVATRDAENDESKLEVAHEALATAWPQLARWLDETYEQRLLVIELEQASELWSRRGRRDDETWGGAALGEALRKVDEWNVTLPSLARSFLQASAERARRSRRRRRRALISIVGGLAGVAIAAVVAAIAFARKEQQALEQQQQIRLAAADTGAFRLEIEPFDWDPRTGRMLAPSERPTLDWTLRAQDNGDSHIPGAAFKEGTDVIRGESRWSETALLEEVEARSGAAYLEVHRGGCKPSLVSLRRLPGYTERDKKHLLRIKVPTCAASAVDMIQVPAGEFFRSDYAADGDRQTDVLTQLETFSIDRTEVTRAAFDMYSGLEEITGDGALTYEYATTGANSDQLPIVGISFFTARNYCKFLGKELPTVEQWQKAFRGGVMIGGKPNDDPHRLTPWLASSSVQPANLDTGNDENNIASVASFPDDTSPYGVRDLAGNVSEWVLTNVKVPRIRGLRTVLGANWGTPLSLGHHRVTWRNSRPDQTLDFGIGIRCVSN